jgi:uncharacterized Zn finger protein (UPF0148 family)
MSVEKAITHSSFPCYKGYNIIADDDINNDKGSTSKNNNQYTASHQTHFLLCETCFWCGTCLINSGDATTKLNCPICDNAKVESLPVSVAP